MQLNSLVLLDCTKGSPISQTSQKWTFFSTPRMNADELLDLGMGTPQDVQRNLHDMARINRLLGGMSAITRHLYPRLRAQSQPATIVDLGTGAAHLPQFITQWANKHRRPIHIIGLDLAARNLAVARHTAPDVPLIQANAARLPFARGRVDYVISSLLLHHLHADQIIALLHDLSHVVQKGFIMSDLVRGWMPYAAFIAVQPLVARHFMTRYDGALSIQRAYTPSELYDLACAAALPHARVHTHFPWRMTLVVDQ